MISWPIGFELFESLIGEIMPAFYGGKLTTFEDDEKESEYGYVRKVYISSRFVRSDLNLVFCCCAMFGFGDDFMK